MNQEDVADEGMDSEINQLRNAASVVSDIIAAEEGRYVSPSPSSSSQTTETSTSPISHEQHVLAMNSSELPGYRQGMGTNMTGIDLDEIELPAYEDNDGSEAASVVQDGFRYGGPGSGYLPNGGESETSSLNEVLGVGKN